ncbi:hypothetical protein MPNT_50030 [Candidatus Methylacidithermus pantelleriae]|uniref:Resolvase/invertase-type recombinase catalytic domain-containing protein n=1 Tax=Candidatus Methylacidithermus pantelleriae TaxID=2744239 RepID=A0A8J2BRP2_9BACT|nr:hypothetical protein MPNT_50030 [Candidatus Methylacidithermus pantelleriae]
MHPDGAQPNGVAFYARVSSADQKSGLRQTIGLGSPSWLFK